MSTYASTEQPWENTPGTIETIPAETMPPVASSDATAAYPPTALEYEESVAEISDITGPDDIPPVESAGIAPECGATAGPTASAHPAKPKRLSRGANGKLDGIWTRHHAICTMGVAADLMTEGCGAAQTTPEPFKAVPQLKEVPTVLLELCQWILNAAYLNFDGSHGLMKHGLLKCFTQWASNRVYYFYRHGSSERGEHPANRSRDNIKAVYAAFSAEFKADIAARLPIAEDRARGFWISVSHHVPFQSPCPAPAVSALVEIGVAPDATAEALADETLDDASGGAQTEESGACEPQVATSEEVSHE